MITPSLAPSDCQTLQDVEIYKQESLNSLVSTFADLPLDSIVTRSLNNGYSRDQISIAIKEYINGRTI